jgi:hypothetical protein
LRLVFRVDLYGPKHASSRNSPNYTCLETTERAQRAHREPSFLVFDILQLEVAEIGGKELFARAVWHADVGPAVGALWAPASASFLVNSTGKNACATVTPAQIQA